MNRFNKTSIYVVIYSDANNKSKLEGMERNAEV